MKTARRNLSDERIGNGTNSQLVEESPQNHDTASCQRSLVTVLLRDKTQETKDEQHSAKAAKTVQIQRATSNTQSHETPCSQNTNDVDRVLAHSESVRVVLCQTSLFQEVCRIVGERVATEVLNRPNHTDNLRPAQITTLEAVQVRSTSCDLLLESSGVHHHANRLVGVEVEVVAGFLACKSQQCFLGVLDAALADEPPRRLGGEPNTNEKGQGPHPLQTVRDTVGPFVGAVEHVVDDCNAEKLTNAPASVDVSGEVPTETDRADFGGVTDGDGLEDTPGDTAHDLSCQKGLDVLGSEEEGNEAGQPDKRGQKGPTVAKALGNPTVDEETNDLTTVGSVTQTSLPRRGDFPTPVVQLLAILHVELAKSV